MRRYSEIPTVASPNQNVTGLQRFTFIAFLIIGIIIAAIYRRPIPSGISVIVGILIGLGLAASIRVADQWEKAVVLRLGKFRRLAGPGFFMVIPFIDTVPDWIDQRVMTTSFNAEQTLTKDTVPVDVDAVLFWMVWDAEKAALEVANYNYAVTWAAQTALRDIIGRTMLGDLLSAREEIDEELKARIDERTEPWGIAVQSVKIRDVMIPSSLQDAMSREAQAERERRARVILGSAEQQIADSFVAAAEAYHNNPMALQLRAMNILYEGLKEKASMVVVPSSLADSVNIGSILSTVNIDELMQQQAGKTKSVS